MLGLKLSFPPISEVGEGTVSITWKICTTIMTISLRIRKKCQTHSLMKKDVLVSLCKSLVSILSMHNASTQEKKGKNNNVFYSMFKYKCTFSLRMDLIKAFKVQTHSPIDRYFINYATCPWLSLFCPWLSLVCPWLSLVCPWLSLAYPCLSLVSPSISLLSPTTLPFLLFNFSANICFYIFMIVVSHVLSAIY